MEAPLERWEPSRRGLVEVVVVVVVEEVALVVAGEMALREAGETRVRVVYFPCVA